MKELLKERLIEVSIDKLTVIGVIDDWELFDKQIRNNELIVRDEFPTKKMRGFDLSLVLNKGLGTSLHINRDTLAVRYEYNPNNFREEHYKHLSYLNLLILHRIRDIHLSRVDIAMDSYFPDLTNYDVACLRDVKYNEYLGSKRQLETRYYGTKKSDFLYRLYDKATEREAKDKPNYYAHGVWRLEFQCNTSRICEDYMYGKFKPFNDMELRQVVEFDDTFVSECKNFSDFIAFKTVYLDRTLYNSLSRGERTKFNKLLKQYEDVKKGVTRQDTNIYEAIKEEVEAVREELVNFVNRKNITKVEYSEEELDRIRRIQEEDLYLQLMKEEVKKDKASDRIMEIKKKLDKQMEEKKNVK